MILFIDAANADLAILKQQFRIPLRMLLFGLKAKEATHKLVLAAEGTGETLALMTWMLFGATVIGQSVQHFTWEMIVFALLSLTVIRMLPIFLSLTGTGESTASKLLGQKEGTKEVSII